MHFSKELAAASVIENAVRTLLSQSIAAGIDAIAFGSTLPGGLLNSVTPTAASTATPLETAMREDFENLITALNAPSADVVFVDEPVARMLCERDVAAKLHVPNRRITAPMATSTVVAVDCAGVAAAMSGEPRIAVSENAAVHEEDTTPLDARHGGIAERGRRTIAWHVSDRYRVAAHHRRCRLGGTTGRGGLDHDGRVVRLSCITERPSMRDIPEATLAYFWRWMSDQDMGRAGICRLVAGAEADAFGDADG